MGSSFANVNICNQNRYSAEVFARYLDRYYTSQGYEKASSSAKADINLYIFYKRTERWVTIYADIWEDAAKSELSEYARIHSKICSLPVFATGVYDGKEAVVAFCNNKVNDEAVIISNRTPAPYMYFQPETGSPFDLVSPFLRYQGDKCRLAKVWKGTYEFPEQKLIKFTGMFGIDEYLISGGFHRYDEALKQNDKFKALKYQVLTVSYSKKEQPAPEPVKPEVAEPPKFERIVSENANLEKSQIEETSKEPAVAPKKTKKAKAETPKEEKVDQAILDLKYEDLPKPKTEEKVEAPKPVVAKDGVKLEISVADKTIKEKFMARVGFKNVGVPTKGVCLYLSGEIIEQGLKQGLYDFVFCTVKKTTADGTVIVFTKAFERVNVKGLGESIALKVDDMMLTADDGAVFNFTLLGIPADKKSMKATIVALENEGDITACVDIVKE